MSKPGNLWRKVHGKITKKPTNFSWLIDEKLAGSGMPTSFDELDWILKQGVKSIVTMTENSLPEEWTREIGYLHVPTPDLTAPDMEKIDLAVEFIHQNITDEQAVMVHCAAGMGRAGTILACYLVKYQKYSAQDAIEKIRNERPGSIQSEVQELAISYYQKHVQN
ncbi:MAG: protein tyrosine phosphatase [Nitrososphaeria archaeon]|nr:protein tyrosine phosphatase [Nitrosopumilaceae archaeon]NIP09199.1 protein tyrosine phosphatase [Nitrosopumilaceae archaeon]NIP91728.1 protein tyrosine phosphatase [Nitrososphaeria archaeon]NIS95567.1 protein tyrosine phosphatase [Nitrosopumilaceae archaeon]